MFDQPNQMERRVQNILEHLLVLVPAFNEEASLPDLLRELAVSLPGCDVCVVDDGSQDQTSAVARAVGARVLRLPCNCGVGVAVRTGFVDALERGYDYLLRLDGDGQHPPAEAIKLVRRMAEQPTDLVIGTRYGEGSCYHGTPFRRLTLNVLAAFVSLICRKKSTDPTSGFWLVSRPLLHCFAMHYPSDYPEPEALALMRRQGFSYEEVPAVFRPRQAGESSIHAWGSVLFALKVFLALFVDRLRSVDVRGSSGYIKRRQVARDA
jgi:glycosyltransferase involved in cell wall biosynthesis